MTFPTREELSTRFTPDQWSDRPPAYATGGPLNIPADAPRTFTEALLQKCEMVDRGIVYIQKEGQEDFQSYADLLREAKKTLSGLRSLGLKPGDRVILQIDTLRDHFTTFWACVLGGFTPVTVAVAPSYNEKNGVVSKLYNTWKLLEGPLILTSTHLEDSIRGIGRFLEMPELKIAAIEPLKDFPESSELYPSKPEDLVFFQLTSGSTGVPKCIQETHRGIVHHIHGAQQFNDYRAEDITLNWLPVDHVVPILTSHLKDVYLGCRQIHIRSDIVLAEPLIWLDLMEKHRVTHSWAPNFGFKLVSDRLANSTRRWDLSSVQFLMNAGEQVTLPVVHDFLTKTAPFGIRSEAMQPAFGMAEVCTCMTYQNQFNTRTGVNRFNKASLGGLMEKADENDPAAVTFVDLGPPVPGVEIRITDQENKVLPEGVVGRFQIRGNVVTPGYLYNDAANREAFVGNGWFNSGDLGFILNGRLTLTGREKEMIIVRGANFYCYEIEDVVNGLEGVEPTFVGSCAVADSSTGSEGLAIFFVPKAEFASAPENLASLARLIKARVASNLGINPSFVIPLEKSTFPKTTSGKIQRNQMKKSFEAGEYNEIIGRLQNTQTTGKELARNDLEKTVLGIWKELLPVPQFGVTDNFFELGGDSLLAARVVSRVRDTFKIEVPLGALFNGGGTVSGLAAHIKTSKIPVQLPPLQKRTGKDPAPATFAQQRLWLLDQIHPGCPANHVGSLLKFTGPFDSDALQRALDALVRRHPALRTSFELRGDTVFQIVQEAAHVPIKKEQLHAATPHAILAEAEERAMAEAQEPIDLATGPVFKAVLYHAPDQSHWLALFMHQIVTDGWSLGIIFNDLQALYAHFAFGKELKLSQPSITYSDFAAWQTDWLKGDRLDQQLSYWRKELAPPLPMLDLPTDLERPPHQTFSSKNSRHHLPFELAHGVRTFARQQGATVWMVLMAAFQAQMHRLSSQEEVVVGSGMSARTRPELEQLVGFFVNTVALRTNFTKNPSFAELVGLTRDKTLSAFAHQHAPFEKIVQEVQPIRSSNRNSIFQVYVSAWDPLPKVQVGPTTIEALKIFTGGAPFELSLLVIDDPHELAIVWEFNTDLFLETRIIQMQNQFELLLQFGLNHPETPLQTLFAKMSETEFQQRFTPPRPPAPVLKRAKRRPVQVQPA